MSTKGKQGFASMSEEKRKAISAKGGSAKVSKGIGRLSPEDRSLFSQKAAATRWLKVQEKRAAEQNGQ